jgi:hypothetical protein
MNNSRILVFAAATLLMTFCLAPSSKAQSTSSSTMHNGEMMTHDKSMGHDESTTMSNPTADSSDHMSNADSETTEHMKSGHMKSGHMTDSHMTDSHMTEEGHSNMSTGGSTDQMSH